MAKEHNPVQLSSSFPMPMIYVLTSDAQLSYKHINKTIKRKTPSSQNAPFNIVRIRNLLQLYKARIVAKLPCNLC